MRQVRWPFVLLGVCSLLDCRPGSDPRTPRDDGAECDEGEAAACYRQGVRWSGRRDEPGSRYRAWRYFKMACEGRHRAACQALQKLDRAACSAGNARGCWNLAQTYRFGKPSIGMDLPRAQRYYRVACQDGLDRACYQLGVLLRRAGHSARARALFRKACKAGHAKACKRLGR